VRIHLDEVVELGSFVELEAVLPEATREALADVMDALGFGERETIAGGYLELSLKVSDTAGPAL
jgi:adenylate cyclase class IV